MMKVYELKTEYQIEPLCIEAERPRFSWKVTGAQKDERCRVFVASDEKQLEKNTADIWESGDLMLSDCVGVEYGGKKLDDRSRYYWKIISESSQSPVAAFETALPEEKWQGQWIGMPANFAGGTLLFRNEIFVPEGKTVARARAYVAGLGCHEVFLNGVQAGNEKLNPAVSDYAKTVYYCAYSLPVKTGRNALGIEVGYGWYGGRKLFAQIYIDYTDGSHDFLCTAHGLGWWISNGGVEKNSIFGGETFDARKSNPLWADPSFKPDLGNGWMWALIVDKPAGKLKAQNIPGITVTDTFEPVSAREFENGVTVFDIGKNISGWARVSISGEGGAVLEIKYAERLKEDGSLNRINLRGAGNTEVYILKGGGIETYEPRFTYHGFQYVEVKVAGKAELLELKARHCRNGLKDIGEFECSDETINKLHEIAKRTEGNNIHGTLTDCPQRDERLGWLNDLTARTYQALNNFDFSSVFPKILRDIEDARGEDGSIPDVVPHFAGGRPADPVSAYILLGLMSYTHYGDKKTLEDNYEGFCGWLAYLERYVKNGVLDFGRYGDWVPAAPYTKDGGDCPFSAATKPEYVSAAYYVWYHQMMERIALILGKKDDAEAFCIKAGNLLRAFSDVYFDREKVCYDGGGQTNDILPLTIKAQEESVLETLARKVNEDVIQKGYHTTCGNQGYRHLIYNLAGRGYVDTIIRLLKNPEYPGWGYMLANGATSVWERWEADMRNNMHSYNHPMFTGYDGFFYEHLAGLSIDENAVGADKFVIAPKIPQDISWARASIETVRGRASVFWEKLPGGKIRLKAEIPFGATALVVTGSRTEKMSGKIQVVYDYSEYIIN